MNKKIESEANTRLNEIILVKVFWPKAKKAWIKLLVLIF